MGFFNEKQVEAFETGYTESLFTSDFEKYKDFRYICSKCGAEMEFEDEWEDVLICSKCGESVDVDKYGFKDDEEYEALYENDGADGDGNEDDCGETYDEVCGELDD